MFRVDLVCEKDAGKAAYLKQAFLKDVFTDMADLSKGHATVHGKSGTFPVPKVLRSRLRVSPCSVLSFSYQLQIGTAVT